MSVSKELCNYCKEIMLKINTKANRAGRDLGLAIIKMVHLMYQNQTARNFYMSLYSVIKEEMTRRKILEKGVEL